MLVLPIQDLDQLFDVERQQPGVRVHRGNRGIHGTEVVHCHDERQPWLDLLDPEPVATSLLLPDLASVINELEGALIYVDDTTLLLDQLKKGECPPLP